MMPIGSRGEKRPISAVQNAHRVFQIATGQAEEEEVAVNCYCLANENAPAIPLRSKTPPASSWFGP